jgi:hypothetical protein
MTCRASVTQLRAATRAEDEVIANATSACRADGKLIEVLEQELLFNRSLKRLVQRFPRPQDEVDDRSWNEEKNNDERREDLGERIRAARRNVPVCPNDQRKPEGKQVGTSQRQE